MSKAVIDKSAVWGNLICAAIQDIQEAKQIIDRAVAAAAIAKQSGSPAAGVTAYEGVAYGFGGQSGSGADYDFALNSLQAALDTFVATTAAGFLATLDNGNVR